jgi:hypothetical protein
VEGGRFEFQGWEYPLLILESSLIHYFQRERLFFVDYSGIIINDKISGKRVDNSRIFGICKNGY